MTKTQEKTIIDALAKLAASIDRNTKELRRSNPCRLHTVEDIAELLQCRTDAIERFPLAAGCVAFPRDSKNPNRKMLFHAPTVIEAILADPFQYPRAHETP